MRWNVVECISRCSPIGAVTILRMLEGSLLNLHHIYALLLSASRYHSHLPFQFGDAHYDIKSDVTLDKQTLFFLIFSPLLNQCNQIPRMLESVKDRNAKPNSYAGANIDCREVCLKNEVYSVLELVSKFRFWSF